MATPRLGEARFLLVANKAPWTAPGDLEGVQTILDKVCREAGLTSIRMQQNTRAQLSVVSGGKWCRAAWTTGYWEYYTRSTGGSGAIAPFFAMGKPDEYYVNWGFDPSQLRAR